MQRGAYLKRPEKVAADVDNLRRCGQLDSAIGNIDVLRKGLSGKDLHIHSFDVANSGGYENSLMRKCYLENQGLEYTQKMSGVYPRIREDIDHKSNIRNAL